METSRGDALAPNVDRPPVAAAPRLRPRTAFPPPSRRRHDGAPAQGPRHDSPDVPRARHRVAHEPRRLGQQAVQNTHGRRRPGGPGEFRRLRESPPDAPQRNGGAGRAPRLFVRAEPHPVVPGKYLSTRKPGRVGSIGESPEGAPRHGGRHSITPIHASVGRRTGHAPGVDEARRRCAGRNSRGRGGANPSPCRRSPKTVWSTGRTSSTSWRCSIR